MSEAGVLTLFSIVVAGCAALARMLYVHVQECRNIHAKLARIMERLGLEDGG